MGQTKTMVSFVDSVKARLLDAGLHSATLVSSSPEIQSFGDVEAVFRLDGLLLRFMRDRGQAFVDLASTTAPTEFYQFDDVEIAMGWKTIDQVLAKQQPDDLAAVLTRLRANLVILTDAFSGNRERFTRARVMNAARERGEVFTARLRGKN